MNIYNYDWWEVLIFVILLELSGVLMAYVLMHVKPSRYFKGRGGRRKRGVFMQNRKRPG